MTPPVAAAGPALAVPAVVPLPALVTPVAAAWPLLVTLATAAQPEPVAPDAADLLVAVAPADCLPAVLVPDFESAAEAMVDVVLDGETE